MQHAVCVEANARYSPALARVFSNIPAISLCPSWIAECRRCDPDCRFLFLGYRKETSLIKELAKLSDILFQVSHDPICPFLRVASGNG
jgi:hypothetical protein